MTEVIALSIMIGSSIGMGIIILRRIPTLRTMDVRQKHRKSFAGETKRKIQRVSYRFLTKISEAFRWNVILQRSLSKMKIWNLKIESKINHWLALIRERSRREKESEGYWQTLKDVSAKKKK